MSYSFSIELDSDSPDNFAVEIRGQGGTELTELTERFKAYPFNVEEGHAIHFRYPGGDANIIIENTGTQSFILEDNQPRIRVNLLRDQRIQVSIPVRTNVLYPYPLAHKGVVDYFKTKEAGTFKHTAIALFFAGTRSEPLPSTNALKKLIDGIPNMLSSDHSELDDRYIYFAHVHSIIATLPPPPLKKTDFFDQNYNPADPVLPFPLIPENVEQKRLVRTKLDLWEELRMTDEQVSDLADPIPAQYFLDKNIEPPGHFVGFQLLIGRLKPGWLRNVDFYVMAPSEQ